MWLFCALVASFVSLALAAQIPLGVANSAVSFEPPTTNASEPTWITIAAPGAFNNSASFNLRQTDAGEITIQSSGESAHALSARGYISDTRAQLPCRRLVLLSAGFI